MNDVVVKCVASYKLCRLESQLYIGNEANAVVCFGLKSIKSCKNVVNYITMS